MNNQTKQIIPTSIGDIAVYINKVNSNKTTMIFLHGVYFDHELWNNQIDNIKDRTVIALDMPDHGESKNIAKNNWTLDDCARMLLEILQFLKIKKVIAVGHSWGSMTIIRSTKQKPELFEKVVLCNMPYKKAGLVRIVLMRIQYSALIFKSFYIKQAGKSLFAKTSLNNNPKLIEEIIRPMNKLTRKEIIHTNKAVIIDAKDTSNLIKSLEVPAIAVVGSKDYVGKPPIKEVITVRGGHISPIEDSKAIIKVLKQIV
jgi:pimeloyl-ACP methyl ester carboxylesterase